MKIAIRKKERRIPIEVIPAAPHCPFVESFDKSGSEVEAIGSYVLVALGVHLAGVLINPPGARVYMLAAQRDQRRDADPRCYEHRDYCPIAQLDGIGAGHGHEDAKGLVEVETGPLYRAGFSSALPP